MDIISFIHKSVELLFQILELVKVWTRRSMDIVIMYLEEDPVAQLVLVPEVGCSRAGVQELVRHVVARHVGEPQVPLHVHRQSRRVDCLQGSVCTLQNEEIKKLCLKNAGILQKKRWETIFWGEGGPACRTLYKLRFPVFIQLHFTRGLK